MLAILLDEIHWAASHVTVMYLQASQASKLYDDVVIFRRKILKPKLNCSGSLPASSLHRFAVLAFVGQFWLSWICVGCCGQWWAMR